MIEHFQKLERSAQKFADEQLMTEAKTKKGMFLITIIWIGYALFPDFAEHQKIIKKKENLSPKESKVDGSTYFGHLELTCEGEPICINEHATKIASVKNVHVLQFNHDTRSCASFLEE